MAYTGILKNLDKIEFSSVLHKCMNIEVVPKINYHDNADMYPLDKRDRPQAGALYANASFDTYARGSGTAGTTPPVDALLIASGFESTTSPATSVTYSLTSDLSFSCVDIDYYRGNAYLTSSNNTVLTCTWTLEPNMPVLEQWSGSGLYAAPTSASGTASLVTGELQSICKGLTCTVGGVTLVTKRVEIALNNEFPDPDEDIAGTNGVQAPQLTGREVTFNVTGKLVKPASYDILAAATGGTKTTLNVVVGTVGGNIITYNMDGYYMEEPTFGDSDDIHEVTVSCRMSDEAADNQFTIVYT